MQDKLKESYVRKIIFAASFAFLALSGCSHNSKPMMNLQTFHDTQKGMSEELLIKTYGEPMNKHYYDNGIVAYEYVERFNMGSAEMRVVEVRRYFFNIQDGKVVSKQMVIKNQKAYEPMNELQQP